MKVEIVDGEGRVLEKSNVRRIEFEQPCNLILRYERQPDKSGELFAVGLPFRIEISGQGEDEGAC